jgi:hypothetical protein
VIVEDAMTVPKIFGVVFIVLSIAGALVPRVHRLRSSPVQRKVRTMTPIRVSDRYPKEHERVLFFDANSEDWYVGWNAYWHSPGKEARPGKWVIPFGDTEDMQVTHCLPCPENPSNA